MKKMTYVTIVTETKRTTAHSNRLIRYLNTRRLLYPLRADEEPYNQPRP